MIRKKNFQSRIAGKISKKMLTIYICIYIILLLVLFAVLTPLLYKHEIELAAENLTVVKKQYETLQDQATAGTINLYLSNQLKTLLLDTRAPAADAVIGQQLSEYTTQNPNILATCIESPEGDFYTSYYFSDTDKQQVLHANTHYMRLNESSAGSYFFPINDADFFTENADYHVLVYSQKLLIGMDKYLVTSFYNATTVIESSNAVSESSFQGYAINNRYDELIYESPGFRVPSSELSYPSVTGFMNEKSGMYFYDTSVSSGWIFTAWVPYTQLLSTLFLIMGLVTGLYFLSPILYIIFLVPTTARYLEPLRRLSATMSSFTAGESIQLDLHTNDEIEDVSTAFNQMVLKINQQIRDIQHQERENSVVNYKLLSTQVDPHFVYNTMSIINIAARRGDTEAIIDINTALIKILRERLNSKLDIYDTLQNELNTLQQYELIMDYRHQNKIIIHYDVDPELLAHKIPKNLLQPLIENSFYHGFFVENKIPEGNIDVLIYALKDDMIIEVSDNGSGIPEERIRQIQNNDYRIYEDQKPHIGIDNIRQRLTYIYGSGYHFEIHSTLGIGTTILITLPL